MSKRSDNGRHRRRKTRITVPSVVGSVAVAAAASGALAMPPAAAGSNDVNGALDAEPGRPGSSSPEAAGALDTVVAAGQSLSAETAEIAQVAHTTIVNQQREAAAEAAARAEREGKKWVLPLDGYRISAGFGSSGRLWSSRHTGLDLAASSGTEVRAMSRGEIIFAGYDGAFGNKIVVRHWDGSETWYCHLSRFVLREGEVMPGTLIGRVGSTGNSTGPHLHLEVHPDGGDAVNPVPYFEDLGLSF